MAVTTSSIDRRMPDASTYSARARLKSGDEIEVRALRREDRDGLLAAVESLSDKSLYRRFFGIRRGFSEREISHYVDVDFRNHVALVAVATGGDIVAGARYVLIAPGQAEVACAVTDGYQGQGLGTILIRHLAGIAKNAGVHELVAEVLPDNTGMLKVFRNTGYPAATRRQADAVHVTMQLG
jgi:ribosomal protein S18 acetylase RimI-like enzyme